MHIEHINEALSALYGDEPLVYGRGPVPCDIMFIGEAPGAREIELGLPFTGSAGENLEEFLKSLGLTRDELYITNVCKFRPKRIKDGKRRTISNRTPTAAEVRQAVPFLLNEIEVVNPRIVIALGNTPLRAVTGSKDIKVGDIHGSCLWAEAGAMAGRCLFALYHPASIIYNRALKQTYEEDLKRLREELQVLGLTAGCGPVLAASVEQE